jgi:hypothetical protein
MADFVTADSEEGDFVLAPTGTDPDADADENGGSFTDANVVDSLAALQVDKEDVDSVPTILEESEPTHTHTTIQEGVFEEVGEGEMYQYEKDFTKALAAKEEENG